MIPADAPLVLCAKGIEHDHRQAAVRRSLEEILPGQSGRRALRPELRHRRRAAACRPPWSSRRRDEARGRSARRSALSTEQFRCYSTDDLIGVEIGGALKNVLAIAAGAVTGAGLGASAQAAMVTRGFVELRRIAAGLRRASRRR